MIKAQVFREGQWVTIAQGLDGEEYYWYCLDYRAYDGLEKRVIRD